VRSRPLSQRLIAAEGYWAGMVGSQKESRTLLSDLGRELAIPERMRNHYASSTGGKCFP
jgi:hypothetical protein